LVSSFLVDITTGNEVSNQDDPGNKIYKDKKELDKWDEEGADILHQNDGGGLKNGH